MLLLLDEEVTIDVAAGATLALVTDHSAQGVDRLIQQYVDKPRMENLVRVLMTQIQDAENMLWSLATERFISTAEGAQLDGLGDIVGQDRNGLSDNDYRPHIRARVKANNSEGTVPDILGVVDAAGAGTLIAQLDPKFPASFILSFQEPLGFDEHIMNGFIQDAKMAGVRAIITIPLAASSETFAFATDSGTPEFSVAQGFDSAASPGTGTGELVRALDEKTG